MRRTDWRQFFPLRDVRPEQKRILDWSFELLEDPSTRNLFVEAPTGVGKSAIAITIARALAAADKRTYISTVDLQLEAEYIRDYEHLGLRNLHSASNYTH
jgi:ATP-dependent DNA helicase DinG